MNTPAENRLRVARASARPTGGNHRDDGVVISWPCKKDHSIENIVFDDTPSGRKKGRCKICQAEERRKNRKENRERERQRQKETYQRELSEGRRPHQQKRKAALA